MEIESKVEDDPWENGLEKVDNVYCSMNWIPEIEAEGYKLRFFDDQAFVQQMVEEPFYLETVRELFDNAKNHVVQQFDDAKQFAIGCHPKGGRRNSNDSIYSPTVCFERRGDRGRKGPALVAFLYAYNPVSESGGGWR